MVTNFPTYIEKVDYDKLDCECCKGAFQRYFEYGIATGGFLQKVLENDLMGAVGRADSNHVLRLRNICEFIYNELPVVTYGSPEKFDAWCIQGGASQDGRYSNIQVES